MAHLIDMSNSRANMAYVGEVPWHRLGSELQPGADLAVWRTAAGMDWSVEMATVEFCRAGIYSTVNGKRVLYRSDTGVPLGVVSDGYKPVQPGEVLEFFADLCADRGFVMETAGCLKGGAIYWALARTPQSADLGINGKSDPHRAYVLLSTSADGTRATDARFTAVRVVCANTMAVAIGGATPDGRGVRTTHRTQFCATATKKALGLVDFDSAWDGFQRDMRRLQEREITAGEATAFFSELLRPAEYRAKPRQAMNATSFAELLNAPVGAGSSPIVTDKAPVERAIRGLADLEHCYYAAPGAQPGTLYGAVQGVTRFVDHVRGTSADKRLTSAWFGQGNALKQEAVERALDLCA